MNNFIRIMLVFLCLAMLNSNYSQSHFVENKGQLVDFNKENVDEVKFYVNGSTDVYFRKTGITYIYKKSDFKLNTVGLEVETDQHALTKAFVKQHASDSTYYHRIDMNFDNYSSDIEMVGKEKLDYYNNYYLPQCPQGITEVPTYNKIKYKNVYKHTDIEFYFKDGSLKYDIILNAGANIQDVKFSFPGINNISLADNKLIIPSPIGDVVEEMPYSFLGKEKEQVEVKYTLKENKVSFNFDYDNSSQLIIDPQVVWQTFYEESFGVAYNNPIETKGDQVVNVGYTFSSGFPTLNPGGGAYFQNSNAGSGDIRIVQFDTSAVRQWATYYGGSLYENSPDVTIDNLGRIIVVFATESTDIPLQNAGGYYDATYTPGTFSPETVFITRFNSNGVRSWASHYDYVTFPIVTSDNLNNIYVIGASEYNNPPVQFRSGAYNQSTVAPDASSGPSDDMFIIMFNSSTSRVWATNLGSSCDEGYGDAVCDNLNNLYILGYGDNYYGTGIVTQNAGGYFDNTLGAGTGGSSSDRGDMLIYKFNANGALVWGTAFGGSSLEWAWRSSSAIKTDINNNVYICATSRSTDLPVQTFGSAYYDGTFSNPIGSGNPENHFIARFNSSTQKQWCTYWGNQSNNYSWFHGVEIDFDNANNMYVAVGAGNGNHYPLVSRAGSLNQAYQSGDVHIGEFAVNRSLSWASYYGGASDERLGEMAMVENSNSFFMTGSWQSSSGSLTVPPPAGAYYNGTYANSPQLISKFNSCVGGTNTTNTSTICENQNKALTSTTTGGTWSLVGGSLGSIIPGPGYNPPNISSPISVTVRYTDGCGNTSDRTFQVDPILKYYE